MRPADGPLVRAIFSWIACAEPQLTQQELEGALKPNFSLLNLQHTTSRLRGDFVGVDKKGNFSMIRYTAKEFLLHSAHHLVGECTRFSHAHRPEVLFSTYGLALQATSQEPGLRRTSALRLPLMAAPLGTQPRCRLWGRIYTPSLRVLHQPGVSCMDRRYHHSRPAPDTHINGRGVDDIPGKLSPVDL